MVIKLKTTSELTDHFQNSTELEKTHCKWL